MAYGDLVGIIRCIGLDEIPGEPEILLVVRAAADIDRLMTDLKSSQ